MRQDAKRLDQERDDFYRMLRHNNFMMYDWERPNAFCVLTIEPNEPDLEGQLRIREHLIRYGFDLEQGFLANMLVPTDYWVRFGYWWSELWH